jgi:hypothetical protein
MGKKVLLKIKIRYRKKRNSRIRLLRERRTSLVGLFLTACSSTEPASASPNYKSLLEKSQITTSLNKKLSLFSTLFKAFFCPSF